MLNIKLIYCYCNGCVLLCFTLTQTRKRSFLTECPSCCSESLVFVNNYHKCRWLARPQQRICWCNGNVKSNVVNCYSWSWESPDGWRQRLLGDLSLCVPQHHEPYCISDESGAGARPWRWERGEVTGCRYWKRLEPERSLGTRSYLSSV